MSIMIRGIEMPTEGTAIAIYKLNGKFYASVHGTELCPLAPVPPHGRLIEEADAIETVWMILRGLGYFKEENPQLEQTVRELFATAPAIEVE